MSETIELDMTLADAICDMEDIVFGEGMAPRDETRVKAWADLVSQAERCACRVTHRRRTAKWDTKT